MQNDVLPNSCYSQRLDDMCRSYADDFVESLS
jgi:hypothetical protein